MISRLPPLPVFSTALHVSSSSFPVCFVESAFIYGSLCSGPRCEGKRILDAWRRTGRNLLRKKQSISDFFFPSGCLLCHTKGHSNKTNYNIRYLLLLRELNAHSWVCINCKIHDRFWNDLCVSFRLLPVSTEWR